MPLCCAAPVKIFMLTAYLFGSSDKNREPGPRRRDLPGGKDSFAGIPKWAPAAVLAFTALIYFRALNNGFASLDDDKYILQNPYIRDLSVRGVKAVFAAFYNGNYHPLTTLAYLFEYSCFKANPLPYHLLNVLLHLANTWLVFKLVEKLSGKSLAALAASLLFAVHPMHVESVAWVSELKDVLYALFYLLSLLFYLRYLDLGYRGKHYLGALLLFFVSLLSKSAAVTLPALLLAADIYRGRKLSARMLLEKIPFFIPALVFGILAIMSQRAGGALSYISLHYSLLERIFISAYAVAFYVVKLAVPSGLSVMHYYPAAQGGALPWQYYASLPFLAVIAGLLLRPGSFRRETAFGAAFFLITVSVMLQIVPVGIAVTAERYTYIPYIGLFYIAGLRLAEINKKHVKNAALALFSVLIIMFSYQTWRRIGVWKDGEVLFTDVIAKYPQNHHGYWIRGNVKYGKGDMAGALRDYDKALECDPSFATAYVNRGCIYNILNEYGPALRDLDRAINMDTTIAEAYNNRGWARYNLGGKAAAVQDYDKAILLDPGYAEAYNNRGWAYFEAGERAPAMRDFDSAIRLNPVFAKAYYNRGALMVNTGDLTGAVENFDRLLKLYPADGIAYFNRGVALLGLKDAAGACKDWKKALESGYKAALPAFGKYCGNNYI